MIDHEPWETQGACCGSDPDLFFVERTNPSEEPTRQQRGSIAAAKRICNGLVVKDVEKTPPCPVREQCLEKALLRREAFGVWGGLSSRERAKILRGR